MKIIASLFCAFCFYTQAYAFGNEDVAKLISAGFAEDVVLNAVSAANPATFDTSADGLIGLKNAGASDAVIQKVLSRQSANQAAAPTYPVSGGGGGNCELEASGPGEAIAMRADGKVFSLTYKTPETVVDKGGLRTLARGFTFGLVKSNMGSSLQIPGERSLVRITERNPEFLDVFFPPGVPHNSVIKLVRMTSQENSRVVQTVSIDVGFRNNTMRSGDSGVPLLVEKRADRCIWHGRPMSQYRMKPASPLESGEYGFMVGRNIYDFAVE
ncbi:MAG: hypothetical protein WC835_02570 [Candidatus Paceibacterota bacterium]|jgi:hypothetical protein